MMMMMMMDGWMDGWMVEGPLRLFFYRWSHRLFPCLYCHWLLSSRFRDIAVTPAGYCI